MAIYRCVHTTFWTDSKVVDDFTPEDKYFMLYCTTNPHTNLCGCYEISVKNMAAELGYSTETIEQLLQRFELVHKVIYYDTSTKELLVRNWRKYNWTKSEKLDKPLYKEIEAIKSVAFKEFLTELYLSRNKDTASIPYPYRTDTTDSDSVSVSLFAESVSASDIVNASSESFERPSLDMVRRFCEDRKNGVDPNAFFDYYSVGDWKDMDGKPVRNWKQKVLSWEKDNPKPIEPPKYKPPKGHIEKRLNEDGGEREIWVSDE